MRERRCTVWIILGTVVFVVVLGAIAYIMQSGAKSFDEWFNGRLNWESVLIGMVYGLSFGFIDSLLLLIGVDGLSRVYERLPGGKSTTMVSLYGNTYSSVVSGFGSAFVGDIISSRVQVHHGPVWGQPIGLFLGCLIVILGRLAFGSHSRHHRSSKKA